LLLDIMSLAKVEAAIREDTRSKVCKSMDCFFKQLASDEAGTSDDFMPPLETMEKQIAFFDQAEPFVKSKDFSSQLSKAKTIVRKRLETSPDTATLSSSHTSQFDAFGPPSASTESSPESKSVEAVAQYLGKSDDDVRLGALRGDLVFDFTQSRNLQTSKAGAETAYLFRSDLLRSWSDTDDDAVLAADVSRVLQLKKDAAVLFECTREVGELAQEGGVALDRAEEGAIKEARENVEAGTLDEVVAVKTNTDSLMWILPSIALTLGFALVPGGAGVAGAVATKALAGGAAAGVTAFGTKGYVDWKQRAIDRLQSELASASKKIPKPFVDDIVAFGDVVEQRLVDVVSNTQWKRYYFNPKAMLASFLSGQHLPLYYAASRFREFGRRPKGHMYMCYFDVALPARDVFRCVQRKHACGSLAPRCEVCWVTPVRGKAGVVNPTTGQLDRSTSVRYTVFSNSLCSRDFYSICREGPSILRDSRGLAESLEPEHVSERFVLAMASPSSDKLRDAISHSADGEINGEIGIQGIIVEALPSQQLADGAQTEAATPSCRVSVAADVDPNVFLQTQRVSDFAIDVDLRFHAIEVAEVLANEFRASLKTRDCSKSDEG
jgi:hypothetical protein